MAETLRWFDLPGLWLAVTVAGSWLSALGYPLFAKGLAGATPATRSAARLVYVLLIPVAGLFAVVLVSQPELAGMLVPAHCHGIDCGAHRPVGAAGSILLVGLAAVGGFVAMVLAGLLLWALRKGHRRLLLLQSFARPVQGEEYQVLEVSTLFACCVGLWRPRILISQSLLETLNPQQLRIVLSHERAHAARYDNLRALLNRWATVFWPTRAGRRIRLDSAADAEQACDRRAVQVVGDSSSVADVIRQLSPAQPAQLPARGATFTASDISARLEALEMVPAGRSNRALPVMSLGFCWCVHVYLLTALSHGLLEWL